MKTGTPTILLILLLMLTLWSFIQPHDMQVWWTEMTSVFLLLGILVFTYRRIAFSNTAYILISIWCAMQIIGAHYTFELVPFDTISRIFEFERNHYDRVAHFAVGLGGIAIAELLWMRRWVSSCRAAAIFSIACMLAIAGLWEIAEWLYAEIDGGEAGQAFLGSQGDIWDAQKDMLLDALGATLAAGIFLLQQRTQLQ